MAAKTVLVLGASSELALETLGGLPWEDARVFAHYHSDATGLEDVAQRIPQEVVPVAADLGDDEQVAALIAAVSERGEAPDAIVHFAAPKLSLHRFHQTEWPVFARELDVQFKGV